MIINNILSMLADIPPYLAAAWAAWMVAGLLLSRWHLKSRSALVYQHDQPWPLPRPKSAVRHTVKPAEVAVEVPLPADNGDPFSDLERIFEQKVGAHRTPGDSPLASPLLNSAGSPIGDASGPPVLGAGDAVPTQRTA